jgi:putative acetyltransferase
MDARVKPGHDKGRGVVLVSLAGSIAMTRATAAALRPFLAADAPVLAAIYQASIEELTAEDYSTAQQVAWAAQADDEEGFAERLARGLTLVATIAGRPVGFATLQGTDHIDMLYVHPSVAGQGVASLLIDALEKLAQARGATRLDADVSDTARPFFERRGFAPERRNTVALGDEWLGNTTMQKRLGTAEQKGRS